MEHFAKINKQRPSLFTVAIDAIWPDLDHLSQTGFFVPTPETRVYSVCSEYSDDIGIQNSCWSVTSQEEVLINLLYLYAEYGPNMVDRAVCTDHLINLEGMTNAPNVSPALFTDEDWEDFYLHYTHCARWVSTKMRVTDGAYGRNGYKLIRIDLDTGIGFFCLEGGWHALSHNFAT